MVILKEMLSANIKENDGTFAHIKLLITVFYTLKCSNNFKINIHYVQWINN
jgi:hypothetical protein